MKLGAQYLGSSQTRFTVWAPYRESVQVRLEGAENRTAHLQPLQRGYFRGEIHGAEPGDNYSLILDGDLVRPDPASRYQPDSVHGPSQIVDPSAFSWTDSHWFNISLSDLVLYEVHPGTFTPGGTLDDIIERLEEIAEMGINCLSLMPVAQFPGGRNWGYDAVLPFAVQNTYGGPWALQRLVNACHSRNMAVVLDVVYNHLGPEGNYLADFGPYFTSCYSTPWGPALNFDSAHSDEVRNFFLRNALSWIEEFHLDGLRLDAVHAIFDMSAHPFLQELSAQIRTLSQALGKPVHLLPESDANDSRLLREETEGGLGHDAQWADDFHHSVHALLTGERGGYYQDFGGLGHLEKALRQGYVYDGVYSPFRLRRHGNSPRGLSGERFLVYTQNHDQVGNRREGDRLSTMIPFEADKLSAGLLLLSPFLPLIFMGQEYGETAPFQYFTSHTEDWIIEATRQGRKEEFAAFNWNGEPPDPQDPETFSRCVLNWQLRETGRHKTLAGLYTRLIQLRRGLAPLSQLSLERLQVQICNREAVLTLLRWSETDCIAAIFNTARQGEEVQPDLPGSDWEKLLHTADRAWDGPGSTVPERIRFGDPVFLPGYSLLLLRRT